jgi:hypothetical protein
MCQLRHSVISTTPLLSLLIPARRIRSQSGPEHLNKDSPGRSHFFLISSLKALDFVHATVAWKLVSASRPQIEHVLSVSKFLRNLFFFVARLSQAVRHPKILTLFGTGAFQISFHKVLLLSLAELVPGLFWLLCLRL